MNTETDHEATVHAVTDTDPPRHIAVPLSAIHVLRPIGDRSPSLSDKLELLFYTGLPARPHRAITDIGSVAGALGWDAEMPRNMPMADAFRGRPFHPELPRRRPSVIPAMPYAPGEPTIYAVTDEKQFQHLTLRLSDIRVVRPVGNRSPPLVGCYEVLFVAGFPTRPYRALVDIDKLVCALGWFAGFSHNTPIADTFEHRPFHPERTTTRRQMVAKRITEGQMVSA